MLEDRFEMEQRQPEEQEPDSICFADLFDARVKGNHEPIVPSAIDGKGREFVSFASKLEDISRASTKVMEVENAIRTGSVSAFGDVLKGVTELNSSAFKVAQQLLRAKLGMELEVKDGAVSIVYLHEGQLLDAPGVTITHSIHMDKSGKMEARKITRASDGLVTTIERLDATSALPELQGRLRATELSNCVVGNPRKSNALPELPGRLPAKELPVVKPPLSSGESCITPTRVEPIRLPEIRKPLELEFGANKPVDMHKDLVSHTMKSAVVEGLKSDLRMSFGDKDLSVIINAAADTFVPEALKELELDLNEIARVLQVIETNNFTHNADTRRKQVLAAIGAVFFDNVLKKPDYMKKLEGIGFVPHSSLERLGEEALKAIAHMVTERARLRDGSSSSSPIPLANLFTGKR